MVKAAFLNGDKTWDRLQSRWVLPAARRLYIIGAVGALVIAMLALAVAIFFQFGTMIGSAGENVPSEQVASPKPIEASALDALFAGPQNVGFNPVDLKFPVKAGDKLGEFSAVSPNGLRKFELLGGKSSGLVTQDFGQSRNPENGEAVSVEGMEVRVNEEYARQLAIRPMDQKQVHVMHLRVVVTDMNGNLSNPQDVVFRINFTTPERPAASAAPTDQVEDVSGPEALQAIAHKLARLSAAPHTPEYFDAYAFAIAEPERCNANGSEAFIQAYVTAFNRVEKKLTGDNRVTFYDGLCKAWSGQIRAATEETARLNAEREAIIARNMEKDMLAQVAKAAARTGRDVALAAAIGAIAFFMTIALFLAFLAIEGHSNAVREALQILAQSRKDA